MKTLEVRWHWWLGRVVDWNITFCWLQEVRNRFFTVQNPDQLKYNSLSSNSKYAHHDAEIHAPISYLFGGNHHGGTGGQSTGVNRIRKSIWPENVAHTTPYTCISKVSVVTHMVNPVTSEGKASLVDTVSSTTLLALSQQQQYKETKTHLCSLGFPEYMFAQVNKPR